MEENTGQVSVPPVTNPQPPASPPMQNSGNKISPILIGIFVLLLAVVGVLAVIMLKGNQTSTTTQPTSTNSYPTQGVQTISPTSLPPQSANPDEDLNVDTGIDTDMQDLNSTLDQL